LITAAKSPPKKLPRLFDITQATTIPIGGINHEAI